MLLRFFRINDPYRLVAVFLAIILLSLPLLINLQPITEQELKLAVLGEAQNATKLIYVGVLDDAGPLTAVMAKICDAVWGRSIFGARFLATLLIFFQAAFFAVVLINNKAYNESTYLPAFVFAVLAFFSFDMMALSPELLASSCVLLALNNIFKEIEFKIQREETILSIGLYLGAASLFLFSYVVFLVGALVILAVFTRLSIRKAMLLLFGFLLPHAVVLTYYYYQGEAQAVMQNFYLANLTFNQQALISVRGFFLLAIIPVAYFVFSLVMLNREARFTKYQSQILQVLLLWLVIAFLEIMITRVRSPHSFYTFLPPLAYLISHYLILIRRKWIAEMMLWILIMGIALTSYLARTNRMSSVNAQAHFPKKSGESFAGKRVLTLSDDFSIYQKNVSASAFLNWKLSQPIFSAPQYYENIIAVERGLSHDLPDIIVDKENYLQPFVHRIPSLRMKLKREGVYWVKINN